MPTTAEQIRNDARRWLGTRDYAAAHAAQPSWVCPVLGPLVWWGIHDGALQKAPLKALYGTNTDGRQAARAAVCCDYLVRVWLPAILWEAGKPLHPVAQRWRNLPLITPTTFPGAGWARLLDETSAAFRSIELDPKTDHRAVLQAELFADELADHPVMEFPQLAWRTLLLVENDENGAMLALAEQYPTQQETVSRLVELLAEPVVRLALLAWQTTIGRSYQADHDSLRRFLRLEAAQMLDLAIGGRVAARPQRTATEWPEPIHTDDGVIGVVGTFEV